MMEEYFMMNYDVVFKRAIGWVKQNTIAGGITVTDKQKRIYPEVTGYYIPTLIKLGGEWKVLAKEYADHMCEIQKDNGSWYDPRNIEPYVFDTCQILKGLVSISKAYPENKQYIRTLKKGCDWVISNIDLSGRLKPCRDNTFSDQRGYSELIHIYCLSPLVDAAKMLNDSKYEEEAKRCLNYYIANYKEKILDFHLLAHFYAYIMEGLVDMGEIDLAREAMSKIADIQQNDGKIPAYCNVKWTCSTALFQFAITWFKLGDDKKAMKTFEYGCQLQNQSGGWYGRYPIDNFAKYIDRLIQASRIPLFVNNHQPNYFPDEEISWAVKFYLDAYLLAKEKNII